MLNVVGIKAEDASLELIESAFNGFGMTEGFLSVCVSVAWGWYLPLQGSFTPPKVAGVVGDLDEQPAGNNAKVLEILDGSHGGRIVESMAMWDFWRMY